MKTVIVTGGIGSGKSTVAALLEAAGAARVDADQCARDVVAPGTDGLADVIERFGEHLLVGGALDRAGLASIVFSDDEARGDLEALLHPRITECIDAKLAAFASQSHEIAIVERPLLVDKDRASRVDAVVLVTAPTDVRVARLRARGMAHADLEARMAAQATDEQRRATATHEIVNDGDHAGLAMRTEQLWSLLTASE